MTAAQYVPLATAIQNASSRAVWIGIPELFLDVANPVDLPSGIQRILKAMRAAGMPSTAPTFYAGHSQGAVVLQDYVNETHGQEINATGQILLNAFLQRKYRNVTFPVSTLTVGGELDGLSRVTRIMEAYYHQIVLAKNASQASIDWPVVVVAGMNHFDAASSSPPLLVKERDLKSEISVQVAHEIIARLTTTFMEIRLGNDTGRSTLLDAVKETDVIVNPLIRAYEIEGSYHFKSPCYDQPPSEACQIGCPWTQQVAQPIMGGLEAGRLRDVDAFHPVSQINPIHLPSIVNNCSTTSRDCVVNTTTVSECVYDELDNLDTGFASTSAHEIRAKLKSRQTIVNAAGRGPASFNTTDGGSICRVINQAAFDWATNATANRTLARFKRYGEPMRMGDDKGPYNAGPLWIYNPLEFNRRTDDDGNKFVLVQAPMLRTPVDFVIPLSAGFHYCKLLSPARAIEWIYVDGLRAHYGI